MKTNFKSNLKQFLFLALALFGTLFGYSQMPQNPSIGGSKTPDIDPFGIGGGKSSDGGLGFAIGGTQGLPRDTSSSTIALTPFTQTHCIFAFPQDIGGGIGGGKGSDTGTGQFNDDDFDPFEIGGKSTTGGLGFFSSSKDIGSKSSEPGNVQPDTGNGNSNVKPTRQTIFELAIGGGGQGTSTDTGQINDDINSFNIGGRGSVGTGAWNYLSYEIGGKNTSGDLGSGGLGANLCNDSDDFNFCCGSGIGVGQFVHISMEYIPGIGCDVNIGGKDSRGGFLTNQNSDIGGKSSDPVLEKVALFDVGGGRGGRGTGTSTGGEYDDDNDIGGRGSSGTGTGQIFKTFQWLAVLN